MYVIMYMISIGYCFSMASFVFRIRLQKFVYKFATATHLFSKHIFIYKAMIVDTNRP